MGQVAGLYQKRFGSCVMPGFQGAPALREKVSPGALRGNSGGTSQQQGGEAKQANFEHAGLQPNDTAGIPSTPRSAGQPAPLPPRAPRRVASPRHRCAGPESASPSAVVD
jgi:hypothetical protein